MSGVTSSVRTDRKLRDAISRLDARSSDWRAGLGRNGKNIIGDERNVIASLRLAPELVGCVRFNEFGMRVELARSLPWREITTGIAWTDEDDVALQAWFQERDIPVRQRGVIADSVALVARDETFHPVREYLDALVWDNTLRLNSWLATYLAAGARPEYLTAVGRKFLVSAVARIFKPGCQVDHILVLESPQGYGKSSVARLLGIQPDWFTDNVPDIHSKDAALQLCGRWIVELAELAAMRRAEVEGVKAFISRPVDVFRPPYGRRAISVPRQSVFIATTNETNYLRDVTGNRRFWPVKCGRIDLNALARDRDQLWAEAVECFRLAETWHLDQSQTSLAVEEQDHRVMMTVLESDIADYLHGLAERNDFETDVRSVLVYGLHLDPDTSDFSERAMRMGAQVAAAIERAGWAKVRRAGRGENRRTVYRSALYQESPR